MPGGGAAMVQAFGVLKRLRVREEYQGFLRWRGWYVKWYRWNPALSSPVALETSQAVLCEIGRSVPRLLVTGGNRRLRLDERVLKDENGSLKS